MRLPPRLGDGTDCTLRGPGETASQAAIRVILGLCGGCLPVQGPPGAGKTHMAALAALTLLRNRRGPVGVTAVTHNAIRMLLGKIEELAPSFGVQVRMQHRKGDGTSTCLLYTSFLAGPARSMRLAGIPGPPQDGGGALLRRRSRQLTLPLARERTCLLYTSRCV